MSKKNLERRSNKNKKGAESTKRLCLPLNGGIVGGGGARAFWGGGKNTTFLRKRQRRENWGRTPSLKLDSRPGRGRRIFRWKKKV